MNYTSRQVLANNLKALMASHRNLDNFKKIVAAGGPSNGTLDRIRRMDASATVDTLDSLAKVFGIDPWQLMVPGLDPTNPPLLSHIAEAQIRLFEQFKQAFKELPPTP
jgi:transcriptional regulator with XRE-family HTH domain